MQAPPGSMKQNLATLRIVSFAAIAWIVARAVYAGWIGKLARKAGRGDDRAARAGVLHRGHYHSCSCWIRHCVRWACSDSGGIRRTGFSASSPTALRSLKIFFVARCDESALTLHAFSADFHSAHSSVMLRVSRMHSTAIMLIAAAAHSRPPTSGRRDSPATARLTRWSGTPESRWSGTVRAKTRPSARRPRPSGTVRW